MNADAEIMAGVAKLESAAAFLNSPYFVAQIVEGMQAAVIRAQSPWLNRKDAAEYVRCSTSEVDRAAREGIITKHERSGTPLFERSEIDAVIKAGNWTPAKKGTK